MKLEVGRKYKARNGMIGEACELVQLHPEELLVSFGDGEVRSYYTILGGKWLIVGIEARWDLMEEVDDNSELEVIF